MTGKEFEGKFDQAKGAVKEKVGEWSGNRKLQAEGKFDQAKGYVKEKLGETGESAKKEVESPISGSEKGRE